MKRLLNERVISLSNCEGLVEVEVGIEEWWLCYVLGGDIGYNYKIEEKLEEGIKNVVDYMCFDDEEVGKFNKEKSEEFMKIVEEMKKERSIENVIIWGVEYDVSVSVVFSLREEEY